MNIVFMLSKTFRVSSHHGTIRREADVNIFLLVALIFAALEIFAVQKRQARLEYIAKPLVMLALFFWLWTSTDVKGAALWFGVGVLFSLVGDVLLVMPREQIFLFGLIAFLLAHIGYIIGFNVPLPPSSAWGFLLAIMIAWGSSRIIRRIMTPLAAQGQLHLRIPILIYAVTISIMLLSALIKLTDMSWNANAALLVGVGAFLFYISDLILAWNKFVSPIQNGAIYNITSYYLGQIMLIAGVVLQYRR
jgi:alkenylglycerophosphocholine hydrolase